MTGIGVGAGHAVERPGPRTVTAGDASLPGVQKVAPVTPLRRAYRSDQARPAETADTVVPVALCEIVHEIPVNR